jgi:LPXTG-motif cell wall-anchored protein
MEGNGVLADDYVFDSSKTYGFGLGIEANDGYTFADGAVITANGGELELYASMAEGPEAALALVFNPVPATGDNSAIAIFAIAAVATVGCVAIALRKKKED